MLFDFIITVRIHPFAILKAKNANKEIWMTEWVMTNFILTFLP
jgi:branched-subunit amino acid transport protein AzlD